MFALRGIAVALTFFVLFYCLLSALVLAAWRSLQRLQVTERSRAGLLFAARVLPFVASVAMTLAFVVPSFQLLEPRSITVDEGIGAMPLALGVCALLLIACGCFRVIAAHTITSRVVAGWLDGARPLGVDAVAPTVGQTLAFRSIGGAPPVTLVGVHKPRVLVSESAVALLSHDELHIALKHEDAHLRARDNLKKLVFRFCPFPGMAKLESAWSQTAELAALDLAAALVKLSRLLPVGAAPVCTVGFVTGSIGTRVERLLAWNEAEVRKSQTSQFRPWYAIPPVLAALLCVFATYGPALSLTHEITEWLVR